MSKQQQLLELRKELARAYQAELSNIQKLIEGGVARIENGQAFISVAGTSSLAMSGEAGQLFREEFGDAALLALERYERNLRREIARLGLDCTSDANGCEFPSSPAGLSSAQCDIGHPDSDI
jgi:hypothetical protein